MTEKTIPPKHPEGLTTKQEGLADILFETKIQAKVRRREQLPDGSFSFTDITRPTSPIDFSQEGEFALKLHERTPEAPLSPIYINLRNLPQNVLDQIGQVLSEIPGEQKPDFCAGIPNAGVPLAEAYSTSSGIPTKEIFTKVQTGTERKIVAQEETEKKGKIRIIDDLVTQADTKLEAIKAAESQGYDVTDIVVLVDREQGGTQQLSKAGYKLRSAFTLTQLLKYYLRVGKIDQVRFDQVTKYLSS